MVRWLRWLLPWWWPDRDLFGTFSSPDSEARRYGMMDGFLGIGWPAWGRLAVASWLVLFAASWVGVLRAWDGDMAASPWLFGIVLFGIVAANGVPGVGALLNMGLRERLLSLAEAAALALLTLSGVVGIGGFVAASLLMGEDMARVGAGIVIGMMAFPLTFGLVFPLAIPLVCSFIVWSSINARGGMSRTAFVLLTSVAAVGWAGVVLIGAVLGVGA